MNNQLLSSIASTMDAHRRFRTPHVCMMIIGRKDDGTLCIPATEIGDAQEYLVPCSILLNHLETAELLLAKHDLIREEAWEPEFTLLSSPLIFDDIYRYVIVCTLNIADQNDTNKRWLPISQPVIHSLRNDAYGKIIRWISVNGINDDLTISKPTDSQPQVDTAKLAATKELHGTSICSPLITASGLIFPVDTNRIIKGLLLEKRSKQLDREPGKWHLPSGFVEANESAAQCVARETYEEMNLVLEANSVRRQLAILTPSKHETRWVNWPHVYEVHTQQDPNKFWLGPNQEVDEVAVFDLDHLPRPEEFAFGEGAAILGIVKRITSRYRHA